MKKQKQNPLVSVIMPVHNAGRFLVPAIESILAQTYNRFELIIVDDGSTDGSWKIINKYRKLFPKRIHIYKTDKQLNAAGNGATDLGLTHAKGVYIARMDADDIAKPKRIEKQVAFLLSHPNVILVGTQADIINKSGKIIGFKRVPVAHDTIYEQYGKIHPIIHPSVIIRRSMLPNPNKLYLHKWGINDDYYTFFHLLNYGEFANLPETLLKYRIHGGNSSLSGIREKCIITAKIRMDAITKFNYRMSLSSLFIMGIQLAIVFLIPNKILESIYPIVRGMDTSFIKYYKNKITTHIHLTKQALFMRKYSIARR